MIGLCEVHIRFGIEWNGALGVLVTLLEKCVLDDLVAGDRKKSPRSRLKIVGES